MQSISTAIEGVHLIQLAPYEDERGFFSRTYCRQWFDEHGLAHHIEQCNLVRNTARGTLRGIHFHVPPMGEVKIVQCVRGAVYDVVVDLRVESNTYGQWNAVELRDNNPQVLYLPKGVGHGYQTLEPETYVTYFMSESAQPETERGIAWNDTSLQIPWPITQPILSVRDRSHPLFDFDHYFREQTAMIRSLPSHVPSVA